MTGIPELAQASAIFRVEKRQAIIGVVLVVIGSFVLILGFGCFFLLRQALNTDVHQVMLLSAQIGVILTVLLALALVPAIVTAWKIDTEDHVLCAGVGLVGLLLVCGSGLMTWLFLHSVYDTEHPAPPPTTQTYTVTAPSNSVISVTPR